MTGVSCWTTAATRSSLETVSGSVGVAFRFAGCRGVVEVFRFGAMLPDKNKMADQSTATGGGSNPTQGKKTTLKISEFLGSDKCILFAQDAFIVFCFLCDVITTSDVIFVTSKVVTSSCDHIREKTLAPTGDGTRGLELARQAS